MKQRRGVSKTSQYAAYILIALTAVFVLVVCVRGLLHAFMFLALTSKPDPKKLAESAESLIPYISEIKPFVEENWERMDEVRKIYKEHSEDLMTEEEKAIVSALFTAECPFTDVSGDRFFTAIESEIGSAELYVMYMEDSELTENAWLESIYIYYMEELVPNWYACTEPKWNASNTPVSLELYKAEREDGGLVRLPARLDLSRLEDGVVRVRYTGEGETRVKLQLTKTDGTDYNYDLNTGGDWEQFTLTEGDGEYTLRVLENVREDRYTPVFDCALTLALSDPAAPFRQSSQFVSFTADSAAAALAEELTGGMETEGEKISAVFDYVVENLTYDGERAATVEAGYLPDVDDVLARGKGICFDYAAVMAAMLRSQGVACKLAVGWAGKQYHAWVEVPGETGEWGRMDPTFFSANRDDRKVLDFVSDPGNYKVRYYY